MRSHDWVQSLSIRRIEATRSERRLSEKVRRELDHDVAEFLASGGQITQVPAGVSGESQRLLRSKLR